MESELDTHSLFEGSSHESEVQDTDDIDWEGFAMLHEFNMSYGCDGVSGSSPEPEHPANLRKVIMRNGTEAHIALPTPMPGASDESPTQGIHKAPELQVGSSLEPAAEPFSSTPACTADPSAVLPAETTTTAASVPVVDLIALPGSPKKKPERATQPEKTVRGKRKYHWHDEPSTEIRWSTTRQRYVFAIDAPQNEILGPLVNAPDDGTGCCQCKSCKASRATKGIPPTFDEKALNRYEGLAVPLTYVVIDSQGKRNGPFKSVPSCPPCPDLRQSGKDFALALDSAFGGTATWNGEDFGVGYTGMEHAVGFGMGYMWMQGARNFGMGPLPKKLSTWAVTIS